MRELGLSNLAPLGLAFVTFLMMSVTLHADGPRKTGAPGASQPDNAGVDDKRDGGDKAAAKKDADAKPDDEPKADAKTIYRKFQARTDIQADKTPLKEVVAQLSKRHGIPIRLDEPAFKRAGIALDVPVTASIKNFTLNAALNHILKDLKLHHIVKDGVVLVTPGDEQAVADAEVEAPAPRVDVPAPRIARAVRAPMVEAVVQPALDAQAVAAMEQQFTRKFRAALQSELRFVSRVCEPTEEQLDGIREVLEKYRTDLVKKYSDSQKRGNNPGMQRRAPQMGFPEPRGLVRLSVARTVKTNLTAAQVIRFEKEIENRNADRSRAAIHTLVARLDEALSLSGEQREKLSQSLSSNLTAAWLQQFETLLLQGNLVVPNNIPPKLVEPILNGTQKTIWRRGQANNNQANQVFVQGAVFGGGMAIVDLIGEDDGEPEEENEAADEDGAPGESPDQRE